MRRLVALAALVAMCAVVGCGKDEGWRCARSRMELTLVPTMPDGKNIVLIPMPYEVCTHWACEYPEKGCNAAFKGAGQ